MTLSTTAARVSYAGNGATTTFAFAFKIWAAANLKVYSRDNATLVDTLQVLNTDYTIDIVTYPNTGNVVFTSAPATGKTIVIVRDMPLTQDLDLIANGAFAAENVEAQLDKLAAEIQTLRDLIARAPRLPVGTPAANLDKEIPNLSTAVASDFLGVNSAGDGWTFYAAGIGTTPVTSFAATLLDDVDVTAFLTTLGFTALTRDLSDSPTAASFFSALGVKSGSATINFGSVADNASSAASAITVTGAAVGDFVLLSASGDLVTTAGVFLLGSVTIANTVSAYVHNDSGGAFDAASQTVYALVLPKALFGL